MFSSHFLVRDQQHLETNYNNRPEKTMPGERMSLCGELVGSNRREIFLLGLSFKLALFSRPDSLSF